MSDKYFIKYSDRLAIIGTRKNFEYPDSFYSSIAGICYDGAVNLIFFINTDETDFWALKEELDTGAISHYAEIVYQNQELKDGLFNLKTVSEDFDLSFENMIYFGLTDLDKASAKKFGVRYVDMSSKDFNPDKVKFPENHVILKTDKLVIMDLYETMLVKRLGLAKRENLIEFLQKCKKQKKMLALSTDGPKDERMLNALKREGLDEFFNDEENDGKGNIYDASNLISMGAYCAKDYKFFWNSKKLRGI